MDTKAKLKPLQSSVWRLFLAAHAKLLDRMEARMTEADLPSLEWYDVLFTLKEAPEYRLRLSELADRVLLSRSNLTRLADRIEKAGLLYREPCPNDRRCIYAVLTDAGLAMQAKMWTVYEKAIAEYFACHVTDEEASVLQQILNRMLSAVDSC